MDGELLDLLTDVRMAVSGAAKLLLKGMERDLDVRFKGSIDIVTEVDQDSEDHIKRKLGAIYQDIDFLAEESAGADMGPGAGRRWILDPLDGTTNYAHRYPFFCISIALEERGEVVLGLVHDPVRREEFYAVKGRGAFLNHAKIHVSKTERLADSILATGFPYTMWESERDNIDNFRRVIKHSQGVRRDGAAALDLCYVACGRLDGFWEYGLKPWDTAAGRFIVEEAGGLVTDYNGGGYTPYMNNVAASNCQIHGELLELLEY